ncbi:MAG: hypothetical protein ABIL70_02540 [candidate division WOR-3 bacterium]
MSFEFLPLIFLLIRPEILNFIPRDYSHNFLARGDHIWTSNGPYGGDIGDITTDGQFIYLGLLMNGIYRLEAGAWQPRRAGIQYATVNSLIGVGPNSLFAGLDYGGLWQTSDGGMTWSRNSTVPETIAINAIFRYNNNTFFLGTDANGLYRSTDGGVNWNLITPSPGDTTKIVAFTKDTLNIYLATSGRGVYTSPDLGLTWISVPSPDPFVWKIDWFLMGLLSKYLYTGCEGGLYYRRDSLTQQWHSTSLQVPISDFVRLGDSILVSTWSNGVWIGAIGDSNFIPRNNGLIYRIVNTIEIIGDTILAGTTGGFFYSTNHGITWQERNQNLDANIIWDIEVNPINSQSIYAVSFGGLYKSVDNAQTWFRYGTIPSYPLFTSISINPQDSANILIGGLFLIHHTSDNGMNWDASYIGAEIVSDMEIDKNQPNYAYATTKKYFFRSTNNGMNWFITDSLKGYNNVNIHPYASETLYIATNSGVFKSNNFGQNFYQLTSGLPNEPFSRINIDGYFPWLLYAGLKSTQIIQPTLYRSTDGGSSWNPTSYPELTVGDIKVFKNLPIYLFIGSGYSKVFFSLNGGDSFSNISPNLPGNLSMTIDLSPFLHSIYLGNLSGVYSFTDTTRPIVSISAPDSFSPDGDGNEDSIKFTINASDTNGIYFWVLEIVRDDTTICSKMEGLGKPDSLFWDGFDSLGVLQKNGLYQAKVYCIDGFLNADSAIKLFYLRKKPLVTKIPYATARSQGRKVALDNWGRIHLVYSTFSPPEIFYTSSIDGINWQEPVDLSNSRDAPSLNGTIVVDYNNHLFVFWEEEINGNFEIVYRRFDGVVWDTVIRLTNTSEPSENPSVVVTANNDLHLVWQERQSGEIYYRRYNFLQGNWTPPVNLSNTGGVSKDPFILSHNQLYLFFSDNTNTTPTNFEIRYRRYDGNQWLAESVLTTNSGNSTSPFAAVDTFGNIHLFWADSTPGDFDIFYKRFTPNFGWSLDSNLTQNSARSNKPTVSIDSFNNIYLYYSEAGEIYRKVRDHQQNWLPAENISSTPLGSDNPSSSYSCNLVWTEGDTFPYRIIYYKNIVPDTTSPHFVISAPDTTYLNDTLFITFTSDELLQNLPIAHLRDMLNDSIQFTVIETAPLNYSGKVYVSGLAIGSGHLIVRGTDLHNNPGSADSTIYIDSLDNSPPQFVISAPDTCFLNDTLIIFFTASETLSGLPTGWLKDNGGDSLQFVITQISPLFYGGGVYVSDLLFVSGPGHIIIRGTDLQGNSGSTDSSIYISAPLDTTPPQFTISARDTAFIGDTLIITILSSEILLDTPMVWLKDSLNDSLQFFVSEDSTQNYSARLLISGFAKGPAHFRIMGEDLNSNITDTTGTIYINTKGNLLPRDSCFAFPNPTRKSYIKFMFYLNQNAHLKIEIFTLAGRKIHTFIDKDYDGGKLYEETMSVENMGSDIYIFRATATAGKEKATVMKKFGVIR